MHMRKNYTRFVDVSQKTGASLLVFFYSRDYASTQFRSETWWKRDYGPTRTQQQTIGNISPRE